MWSSCVLSHRGLRFAGASLIDLDNKEDARIKEAPVNVLVISNTVAWSAVDKQNRDARALPPLCRKTTHERTSGTEP